MAEIITKSEDKECQVFNHKHKGLKGTLAAILYSGNYCPECGVSLRETRPVTTSECSNCGKHLFPIEMYQYKYCSKCGVKFD